MWKFITGRRLAAVGAAVLATSLAGCGSGGGSGAVADANGIKTLQVGIIPSPDSTVLYLGQDKGIFKKHGIKLEFHNAQGGAAIVPPVVSGQYQLGFSNVVSIMQGVEQNLPLQILAPSGSSWGQPGKGIINVYAMKGAVSSAKDLQGKTVAVNTLGNLLQTMASVTISKAGGDPSKVKFVEMAPADAVSALKKGTVDAAVCNEPFCMMMKSEGAVQLGDSYQDLAPGKVVASAAWFANSTQIEKDTDLYKNLQAALNEANAYATDHPDEARAEILKVVPTMDPAQVKTMLLNNWPSRLTEDLLSPMSQAAVKFGLLKGEPDFSKLMWSAK